MVLVLDCGQIDEISQVGGGIPTDVVGVDVHFAQFADHFGLVGGVGFCAGSGCGDVLGGLRVVVGVAWRGVDGGEGKGVCDLELGGDVHSDEEAGRSCGESLRTVFDYFHHDLFQLSISYMASVTLYSYQCLDLNGLELAFFSGWYYQ